MARKLVRFASIFGVLCVTLLVFAVFVTAQTALDTLETSSWIVFCQVMIVFFGVMSLFAGIISAVLVYFEQKGP